jgi:hypothetical protein
MRRWGIGESTMGWVCVGACVWARVGEWACCVCVGWGWGGGSRWGMGNKWVAGARVPPSPRVLRGRMEGDGASP